MIQEILSLKRNQKKIIIITNDLILNLLSSFVFLFFINQKDLNFLFFVIPVLIYFPIYILFDLYNNILRYSGSQYYLKVLFATSIYGAIFLSLSYYLFKIYFLNAFFQPLFFFTLIIFSRASIILIYNLYYPQEPKKNIIIYGAGEAGFKSIRLLKNIFNIVCLVDDDLTRDNQALNGYKIFHSSKLKKIVEKNKLSAIFIAITNLSEIQRREIIKNIKIFDIQVKILPDLTQLLDQEIRYSDFRSIKEDDLLDRQIIITPSNLQYLEGMNVIITGGGGTIGSELAIQLMNTNISKLYIIDNSEYNLYNLEHQLINKNINSIDIKFLLVDINNQTIIENIFIKCKPNVIFHTAAYKHVPIVENNINESIKNNFFATIYLVNLSHKHKINYFVYISSDKAVRPTNIMGATKRLSEIYIQKFYKYKNNNNTNFSIVRFGNVIGSSGSAINLFSKQILEGGPVTITHQNVTRYFMTRKESALLIFECCNLSKGGEIFLLDMGSPIKILDLVKKMISLYGLHEKSEKRYDGIEIKFIGLRQGEKIYEELLVNNTAIKTSNKYIYISREDFDKNINFEEDIIELKKSIKENNKDIIFKILEKNVESFKR